MSDGYSFPVDRTSIMAFASALGDTNAIYHDESYAASTPLEGVIAPPTFAIASAHWNPNYAFRGVRRAPTEPSAGSAGASVSARSPGGQSMARVLHGEQRFEYHRPLRPGMALTVTTRPGKSWDKEGRRGGKLRFTESIAEYRDADGELVVTATSVGIVTEKAVED